MNGLWTSANRSPGDEEGSTYDCTLTLKSVRALNISCMIKHTTKMQVEILLVGGRLFISVYGLGFQTWVFPGINV